MIFEAQMLLVPECADSKQRLCSCGEQGLQTCFAADEFLNEEFGFTFLYSAPDLD